MSKPRWIDGGVFRTLRTATRKRTLSVIVGPGHGSAEISSRAALRAALGDADRSTLVDDPRLKSASDEGLAALWSLQQPGLVTTAVSDALTASAPDDLQQPPREFGPDGKGLVSAYGRKGRFVVHLNGWAGAPETLILSARDKKPLTRPDSRYQAFLRATFGRTVLFSGFALDDPGLIEVLDDVGRVFNGHVPPNMALVAEGSTDPAAALRASMHYGTTVLEFPAQLSASQALAEVARLLEELEVPKPATGDPPGGFAELTAEMKAAVPSCGDEERRRFAAGYLRSWSPIKDGLDAPRTAADRVAQALAAEAPEGKVPVVLVKGHPGQGKTTFLRRMAWDLSEGKARVFWREPGFGLPDRYVPAEADDARAVFVIDAADRSTGLPTLLAQLAREGGGKARFLLAADSEEWERSGLDHRVILHAHVTETEFGGLDAEEAPALAARLAEQGRLAMGVDQSAAGSLLAEPGQSVLDAVSRACHGAGMAEAVQQRVAQLGDDALLRRALLATAMIHRYGMSLDRKQLARLLGVEPFELDSRVVQPTTPLLVPAGDSALRTPHPIVAESLATALATDEAVRDEMVLALLSSLSGTPTTHPTVFHQPSELIRSLRHGGPLAPLTLSRFFEAGAEAARNDVLFWFDRGRADTDFQRWDAALSAFDQALRRRPQDAAEKAHNALVHANRARCLMALGKKREALAATEEGLRAAPQDASLLRLHEKLGGRRRGSGGGPRGRGGRDGRSGPGRGGRSPGSGGGGSRGAGRATAQQGRQGPARPGDRPAR